MWQQPCVSVGLQGALVRRETALAEGNHCIRICRYLAFHTLHSCRCMLLQIAYRRLGRSCWLRRVLATPWNRLSESFIPMTGLFLMKSLAAAGKLLNKPGNLVACVHEQG